MIEYILIKNIKILVIFFYKRWWRDMYIVYVFVWNFMIGYVFFFINFILIYLEIFCIYIIVIVENYSKEIIDNWKKIINIYVLKYKW